MDRAAARGELTGARVGTVIDLIYGSLWYRIIFDVGPLDNRWADAVARVAVIEVEHSGHCKRT